MYHDDTYLDESGKWTTFMNINERSIIVKWGGGIFGSQNNSKICIAHFT